MQRTLVLGLCALAMAALAGCATMARWERISVGMDPSQVRHVMGRPTEIDVGESGEGIHGTWTYVSRLNRMSYEVMFEKGKVVGKHAHSWRSW